MARPRTAPVFSSIHGCATYLLSTRESQVAAARAAGDNAPVVVGAPILPRDTKSGGEWHDLVNQWHAADSRCVICDLATVRTQWLGAMTATLGLLVPSSALDGLGGKYRSGYVAGNLAIMCSACVDARGEYAAREERVVVLAATRSPMRRTVIGGVPVVVVGLDLDATRVPLSLPTLRKAKAPEVPDPATMALISRRAEGRAARSAAARAARGLPF